MTQLDARFLAISKYGPGQFSSEQAERRTRMASAVLQALRASLLALDSDQKKYSADLNSSSNETDTL